jgi:hypothetical protein
LNLEIVRSGRMILSVRSEVYSLKDATKSSSDSITIKVSSLCQFDLRCEPSATSVCGLQLLVYAVERRHKVESSDSITIKVSSLCQFDP